MTNNPVLADLDTCRTYIVRRASDKRAARDSARALIEDFAKALLLGAAVVVLAWAFLCP